MNPYTTIPAPNQEGADTTFTNDDWVTRGRPPRIILSEGWTSIGVAAFNGAAELQTIRIPASVVSIQHLAFGDTINLREVEFVEGSHLDTIDEVAFFRTTALERINIPASVRVIADQAFYDTSSLVEVSFEQNSQITTIHPNAFIDSGLTRVAIGETALNRLNNNPRPLHFGPNNNFYGREDVTIVSRSQQINSLMFSMRNTPTRPQINDDLTRQVGTFLLPPGVIPRSSATLAASAPASNATAGGRKSRRRKRGIRRKSRKSSRRRRTLKRRRTMKRK